MNTLFVGKVLYRFDELPSTNDYAVDLVAKASNLVLPWPPEGAVVRADRQSAGRGQFGSRWSSEVGKNLTMSILLYPRWLAVANQFDLSMAVALGLRDCVEDLLGDLSPGPALRIKWPNDLYLQNQKVAGILLQNSVQGSVLQSSVVGIGLNVNQVDFDPALPNPSSLARFLGRPLDLEKAAESLCFHVEKRYLMLRAGHTVPLREAYTNALYGLEERRFFREVQRGEVFEGIVRGVDPLGHLCVEKEGRMETYGLKEIEWLHV
jgi:BirA family transcriptional regulator, biotin operon repressor / biotin---[acetyl-CoA-carboxylase] ligase